MPYIITSLCTNDGACVDVCPVACIHTKPGAPQFYIDPEVCIDCEQCEIVCPVDAIFKDIDIPAEHEASIEVNASFFRKNKAAVGPVAVETAWQMVRSAQEYAETVGIAVAVAVVDEAGYPIAVGKMDGAEPRTTELGFPQGLHGSCLPPSYRRTGGTSAATLAAQPRSLPPRPHHARWGRASPRRWRRDCRWRRRRGREPGRARYPMLPGSNHRTRESRPLRNFSHRLSTAALFPNSFWKR